MASIIKSDNIQKVSDASNIIKKCGSTITLGSSGATIALACGATQTGFGRTGTVNWCTTAKTSPLTISSGNGYFINTTGGAITVTLPSSPSAGDIVALKDYANTWDTYNVTLGRNGSKINGNCLCATLDTEAQSITLIYVDGTKGWQDIHDSTSDVTGGGYISATGGCVSTVCTNFKLHVFNSSGTFCVSAGGGPKGKADYFVVAGGGGGGGSTGPASHLGGGGAGGYRESKCSAVGGCFSASPLAGTTPLVMSPGPYTITVGGGGTGGTGSAAPGIAGTAGSNSVFSTITSAGGGGGGGDSAGPLKVGGDGGSGGGGAGPLPSPGGTGNTPPVSPPQGNPGGSTDPGFGAPLYSGGGGGGAGAAGTNGSPGSGGTGGAGVTTSIDNTPTARGGGGAGQQYNNATVSGGSGGGGNAGPGAATNPGTINTGGGGGGGGGSPSVSAGGTGGSGIVIIRYKFQ